MEATPHKKFVYYGEMEVEGITQFLKDARVGSLYPYLKSEPVYEHPDGFVKVLVGKDFEEVAFDPTRNVLVEFVVEVLADLRHDG